jgi:hypothetical protein
MEKLQHKMDILYYDYIEIQAKKNNISITLPIQSNLPEITNDEMTVENTETEVKFSDEYVYKKPWNKLNSIHKIIKVKEFIDTLNTNDIDMKKKLKKQLVDMIKDKKLNKKTDVNYDINNGNIVAIPIIQYKDSKYIIVNP